MAGLKTEVWANEIAQNIFPDNSFVVNSKDDTKWVNNDIVHLPQSGTLPSTVRNRATLPATIVQRVDAIVDYSLHAFSTDPSLITDMDSVIVSYAKRQDMLSDHIMTLDDKTTKYMPFVWAANTTAAIVTTTGTTLRAASAVGATGQRKMVTKQNIIDAMIKMDMMNIPRDGRCMLLNPMFIGDLLSDATLTSRDWVDNNNAYMDGTIARLFGCKVYTRSEVGAYANGLNVPKDPDALADVLDDAFGMMWHPSFVRRALGATKAFIDEDKPEYYGTVFSAQVRAGGSKSYTNGRGIVCIKEGK
jgi:hypothetical protein